jgi:hypothetical protein
MGRVVLAMLAPLPLAGCAKPGQKDCFICNAIGFRAILGDDQSGAREEHPAWFLFPFPAPASQPTSQPATQPAGTERW